MITEADAQRALDILRGAGIAGLRDAQADVWAMVINAAPLTVSTPSPPSTGRGPGASGAGPSGSHWCRS